MATWRRPALSSGRETARGQGSRAERRQRLLDSPESKLAQERHPPPRPPPLRPRPPTGATRQGGSGCPWLARRTTPSSRAELGLATGCGGAPSSKAAGLLAGCITSIFIDFFDCVESQNDSAGESNVKHAVKSIKQSLRRLLSLSVMSCIHYWCPHNPKSPSREPGASRAIHVGLAPQAGRSPPSLRAARPALRGELALR